jgi:hypothetical protein
MVERTTVSGARDAREPGARASGQRPERIRRREGVEPRHAIRPREVHRPIPARSRQSLRRSSARRTHDFTVPSGLAHVRRELGMRQPVIEGERDRLLGSGIERIDAVAHRPRLGAREEHLGGCHGVVGIVVFGGVIVVARERHGIDLHAAGAGRDSGCARST